MMLSLLAAHTAMAMPEMVGRGVISTKYETIGAAQARDGTMVFVRSCPGTLQTKTILCQTKLRNGKWQPPSVLPFSGLASDFNPQFSPDGKHLFFISSRDHTHYFSVWVVDRNGNNWGDPHKLEAAVNGKGHQLCASQSASGDLFVTSTRDGNGGLYFVKRQNGGYAAAQPIEAINKVGFISDACVAPDESFIIFSAVGGKDEILTPGAVYQRGDLYVSFIKNGEWQVPFHFPSPINTSAGETCPTLSPDGSNLYFASDRGFMIKPRSGPLTYREIVRNIHGEQNCLSKIFRVRLSDVLAISRR